MTFVKNDAVVMPNNKVEFLLDLTLILKSGVDHGLITKEDVDYAWELATISDEELHKRAEEKMGSMISGLAELTGKEAAGEILRELTGIDKED